MSVTLQYEQGEDGTWRLSMIEIAPHLTGEQYRRLSTIATEMQERIQAALGKREEAVS